MKKGYGVVIGVLLGIAVFGLNPFASTRDTAGLLTTGYGAFETGVQRQANGIYQVRALTRMPGVKAEMVRWWFADYMSSTEHYQKWHPTAHIWMDWENKKPGEIVGAAHLVHEYIGPQFQKLRIQFVDPALYLDDLTGKEDLVMICARAGELERPLNLSTMCHIIRDTQWGAEMRSVFWMGDISAREGNENVFSVIGLLGNTWLARQLLVDEAFAVDLMTHAIEEMGYLADFLPALYAQENP